jgi:hypothetical protein
VLANLPFYTSVVQMFLTRAVRFDWSFDADRSELLSPVAAAARLVLTRVLPGIR